METQQLFSKKISPDSINLLTKTTEKKIKLLGPSSSVLPLCQSSILSSLTAPEFIRVVFPVVYFMLFEPLAINRCWYTLPPPPHNTSPAYGCCCCCCYCNRLQTHLHCSALLRSWNYFFFLRFSLTAARAKDKPSFQWHQYCVRQETKGNRTLGNTFCSQTFKLN